MAAFDILASRPGGAVEPSEGEFREDGWFNSNTGIGDPTEGDAHYLKGPQLTLPELSAIYYGDDLAYRVVSKLPSEAMKRKPVVKNKKASKEQVTAVQTRLDALGYQEKIRDSAIFGRLFGDAGLWLATNADQTQPFRMGEPVRFLKQLDRRVLIAAGYYCDPNSELLGQPSAYSVVPVGMTLNYQALGSRVHATRVPMFHGMKLDPVERAYNMGWNYSILQRIYGAIKDMGETWGGISVLLRELSIKVLKVKGLKTANEVRPDLVRFRLKLARQTLSTLHMLAIDADAESFERVESGTLTGAAAILEQLLVRLSAAAEMPVTVLYGRSPSGLNATGESDLQLWYDSVATYQQNELLPPMMQLLNAVAAELCPGVSGWEWEFPPLKVPTEAENLAAIKAVSDLDIQLINAGIATPEQIAVLRFGPEGHWRPDYSSLDISVAKALASGPPSREPLDGPGDGGDPALDPSKPPAPPPALPAPSAASGEGP